MDDFVELSTQKIFLAVYKVNLPGKTDSMIALSAGCSDNFQRDIKFVKILVNSKAIKIKPAKAASSSSFRIRLNRDRTIFISRSNAIVEQLKELGWTFCDGRKFDGEITEDGWIFYKNKILKVRESA